MALLGTSKNLIVTFFSEFTPPHIFTGFSSENIMDIPDVDIIKSTMGCDGAMQWSVVAKKVEGQFSLYAGSPSVPFVYGIMKNVYRLGIPLAGTLTVEIPSLVRMFTFREFTFVSGPRGLSAGDEMKPVTIKWVSQLPDEAGLGAIAETLIGAFG